MVGKNEKAAVTSVQDSGCSSKKYSKINPIGMLYQMIIPMIFVYLPCAGIINLPMMGLRMNVFPNMISASLTFFPLLDAFIIMFGVKSYR